MLIKAYHFKASINWQQGDGAEWAFACDFKGGDLTNAQIRGEDCSGRCASTSGCTHFTWTTWNGGTCWMKSGSVTKSDAHSTSDSTMVCGIVSTGVPSNFFYTIKKYKKIIKHYNFIKLQLIGNQGTGLLHVILKAEI